MLNYGPKKDLQKRPDEERKFSLKNKTDKYIFIFVLIGLLIVGLLIGLFVFLYYYLF